MTNLWILAQIISPATGYIYMLALSRWRFSKWTVIVAAFGYIALVTILNYISVRDLSHTLSDKTVMDFVYRISNIALAALVVFFLVRQPIKQTIFTVLTAHLCVMIVDTFAITLRIMFGNAFEILWNLLLYSIMIFTVIKLRTPFLTALEHMRSSLWKLCLMPTALMTGFFLQISIPTPLERAPERIPVAFALCGISIGVYSILIFLFKAINAQSNLEHNAEVMQIYVTALENQNEAVEQTAKKVAILRHDLRHIAQMMSASIQVGNIGNVMELIAHLDKDINEETGVFSIEPITGHKLLDVMFGFYIGLAVRSNIDIKVSIKEIESVSADRTELAVTLSNILENAVNACKNQPEGEERIIRIIGHKSGNQYFLGISNTFFGDIHFDPNTELLASKEEGHGIGSKSIAYFVEKYGATMQYQLDGNKLTLRLLI